MQQAFFTQIKNITENNDISESITTVRDSANTTCCSIQHFVQGYSPKLTKNTVQGENTKSVSFKKRNNQTVKVKSKNPLKPLQNKPQAIATAKTWATCLGNNMIQHNCQQKGDHNQGICRHYNKPIKNCTAIEKVNSCPIKYTSCADSESHICKRIQNRKTPAKSTELIENSYQVQRYCGTEQIVIQLKGEIEKLREHLEYIATNNDKKREEMMQENAKQLQQIRNENKSLKRELESKRKLLTSSMMEVDKARDILSEYERKVNVLHEQTLKSSKLMKQSKDKFCKCLKDKEQVIKGLKQSNYDLLRNLEEKDVQYQELNKTFVSLQGLIFENNEQFSVLSANNNNFTNVIKTLEKQLENSQSECEHYKEEFKNLEQKFENHKCALCEKLESKVRKQKEKYENRIKTLEENEKLAQNEISQMIEKLKNSDKSFEKVEILETRCNNLKAQIMEYEKFSENYKKLEKEYNEQYQRAMENEVKFQRDRHELRSLVEELTNVVKENKVTLLQLSQMNKDQEAMLISQSTLILEKDRQIESATSEIEVLQKKSYQLEKEIEALRQVISGPCSKEACLSASRELEELRSTLSAERDTVLLKEQIIKDQTQTISSLQQQIKEKIYDLNRAKDESSLAEKEILKINDHLIRKNREVERHVDEKEHLIKKLKKLEYQKSILSNEMMELEKLLNNYCNSHNCNQEQESIVFELKREVAQQRQEWEIQRQRMSNEKDKAVNVAKFAAQKLLDTVSDYQRQVNMQKQVQMTLTKMLYEKEEELRLIQSKMSSINSIANNCSDKDYPIDELYRSKGILSNGTTASSQFFSSCSNCCSNNMKNNNNNNNIFSSTQKSQLQHLFNMITRTNDEEPIRDG